MATFPPNGTPAPWDDDLFTWLQVGHNDDGTLKAGSLPIATTYLVTTDDTTMTLWDSSGEIVATDTDLADLFNPRVDSRQLWLFGPGDFPIATTLSIPTEDHISITLRGCGGLNNINIQNVTVDPGATRFKYTPTTGALLDVHKAQGVQCQDIDFHATHASWTGSLLDFQGDFNVSPRKVTRHSGLQRCTLRARNGDTQGALLEVSTCVDFSVHNCLFQGGRWCVRGIQSAEGLVAGEPSDEIHVHDSRFQYYQSAYGIIANSYRNWSFNGCVFERATDGSKANILMQDDGVPGEGVAFNDCCGFDYGDPADPNDALFTWNGNGLSINNFFGPVPNDVYLLYINDDSNGVHIAGLDPSTAATSTPLISIGAGTLTDVTIRGNNISESKQIVTGTQTQPFDIQRIPYKSVTADTTLIFDDHMRTIGVSASGGARAITLPNADCKGMKVTIKKTDSSGNAVTVTRGGSDTIEGATTYGLATQYKYVTLVADGASVWYIVAAG